MANLINKIIPIGNKKTCIRLADAEWEALDIICEKETIKRNDLIELINENKDQTIGLTYSLRLFILIYLHHNFLNEESPDYANKKEKHMPIFDAIRGIL